MVSAPCLTGENLTSRKKYQLTNALAYILSRRRGRYKRLITLTIDVQANLFGDDQTDVQANVYGDQVTA